jgi:SMODS and SLOG-associating 2TM effector domain 1/Protein of unknown function (DUF4231)
MDDQKRQLAALETWRVYKRWAAASARMKKRTDLLKNAVLWLSLAALVLGPLATSETSIGPDWLVRTLTVASGAVVAFGAFLSDKVIGPDGDVPWVRARQAAEGLKSLVYAFLVGAPPFDVADDVDALDRERKRIEEAPTLSSLVALPIEAAEAGKGFPTCPLAPAVYVTARAKQQKEWFEGKTTHYHNQAARLGMASKLLGLAGVALSVTAGYLPKLGVWVAIVTSVAGALATQVTSGRSRFLEKSYHDTAARLGRIITRWEGSDQGPADAKRLVGDCEQVLRDENAGWVAAMLEKKGGTAPSAGGEPDPQPQGVAPAPGTS